MAGGRRGELAEGLAETRRYLLSHHEPSEYDRCYRLRLGGQHHRLCARCLGVYPGILAGLVLFRSHIPSSRYLPVLTALALPALVDWAWTAFGDAAGWNPLRTATGGALGVAYGLGLGGVFLAGDLRPLVVGAGYGLAAGALLLIHRNRHGHERDGHGQV